jgi:cation-transporting ATPase I
VLGPLKAPIAPLAGAVRSAVATVVGSGRRVVRTRPGHGYVPVRGLNGHRGEDLAKDVEVAVASLRGVRWAQVNPVLAAVVVSFDDDHVGLDDIAEVVDSVQEVHGDDGDEVPVAEHPADPAAIVRTVTAIGADAVGVGGGIVARLVRAPALPVEVASAITAADGVPAVRRFLDQHPRAAMGTVMASAALQGLGQGPLGLIVDGAHRLSVLGELTARRRTWLEAEPELCSEPAHPLPSMSVAPRPEPLPASLAERYAETSSMTALGAAVVTFGMTLDPVRTADMLLAGVPRAARLGMEGFGAALGRQLASRDVIVMDPSVLRRLDVVDTVVVDAGLEDAGLAGPELYDSVRQAAHDLVIGGKSSGLAAAVGADFAVAGGTALARSVRQLQAEGRVVALVSHRAGSALRAADVGIGIVFPAEPHPPWGADVICRHPADAPGVIDATRLARQAGRLVAGLSAAGSVAGGVAVLNPVPGAGRRAVTAVQVASLVAMAAGEWTAAKLPRRVHGSPPAGPSGPDWHAFAASDVTASLDTGRTGLTDNVAAGRLAGLAGRDPDEQAGPGVVGLLVSELSNPLTAVLGIGATMSALTGSMVDAALIAGVIGMDAGIGVAQRVRTEAAIARLGRALKGGQATVVRDGRAVEVDARSVVPGDLLELRAGEALTADARVVEAAGLELDESPLTGESLPVAKDPDPVEAATALADRSSMVFAGTSVAAGQGRAVVVATGSDTESRRGAVLTAGMATTVAGVEARLKNLTDKTLPVILAAGAGISLHSLLRGAPAREAVSAGVSLATSAVPEGLPFVASVAQAAAAHRLARSDVLVRNPRVLEALGRVDVLCFDKTGTLTEGRLQVTQVSDGAAGRPVADLDGHRRGVLAAALRATPRARPGGLPHPTDQAVVDGAGEAGVAIDEGVPGWKKAGSLPFEPGRGFHAVTARRRDGTLLSVKGAPEVVLPRCGSWRTAGGEVVPLDDRALTDVFAEVERLARQGLRVLAVAERRDGGRPSRDWADRDVRDLELQGFVGISDEARSGAAQPLGQLARAGIQVVMITGDHPSTAEAVARQLGLLNGSRVLTGPAIDVMTDDELDQAVGATAVFARVSPAHKVRIVAAFQRGERVVAMAGDGANDAQAIRLSHVGVAFGSRSTAAAQAAADIVIARDDLDALIETMIEGRAMWASVRDALAILLGGNLGEVAFATGGALISGRPPLGPRQLLTVNLFTDLVPAMAIAVQPPRSGRVHLEREGPETSLSGPLARDVALRAVATAAGAFGAWSVARATGTPARARTVALVALVGTQLGQTMVIGRRSPLVLGSSALSAAGLAAIVQTPGVSQFFGCQPLGPGGWAIAGVAAGAATAGSVIADLLVP